MGFGKDGKGVIMRETRSVALSTLAGSTGIFIGTKLATTEDFRILKTEVFAHIRGLTPTEGNPLLFGIADGALSNVEVNEAINSNGPLQPGTGGTVQEEIADRPVWLLSGGDSDITQTELNFKSEMGGTLITWKPRWTFRAGTSWNWFIFNLGSTMTTGALVEFTAKHFGVWVQ